MTACARCGSANPPDQTRCTSCGTVLEHTASSAQSARLHHTLMGHGSPASAPVTESTQPVSGKTLFGVPAAPAAPQATAPRSLAKRTVLGLGAYAPAPSSHPPNPAQHTMMGIGTGAPPSATWSPEEVPPPPPSATSQGVASPPTPSGGSATGVASLQPQVRTVLGIARPGIAPLNPGVAKQAPLVIHSPAAPAPDDSPFADEPVAGVPPRRNLKPLALVLLGVLALLGSALAVWLLLSSPPAIYANVVVDAQGTERLELRCNECSDGTTVELEGRRAPFAAARATLETSRPLRIGDNRLALNLTPPRGRPEHVELDVPIEYRVRADLKALEETPPKLRVVIETVPSSRVIVDGHPIAVSADGVARYDVDVEQQLTGPASTLGRLERKLTYGITPPNRSEARGELTVQLGVVPLLVEAPGESIVLDGGEFMLAGRAQKGATVTVNGRDIPLDSSGHFAQEMTVSTPGETRVIVRAAAPGLAPRLVPVHVRRVTSLKDEAVRLRAGALDRYEGITGAGALGQRVAIDGELSEVRAERHTSVLLLEMGTGCTNEPCLLRVVHGVKLRVQKGQKVSVFGKVTGNVQGLAEGRSIPQVHADVVLVIR